MSDTEEPPSKSMKVDSEDEEDLSNRGNKMKRKLVLNPVAKFGRLESEESEPSTSNNPYVNPENLQKRHEFQILDEVNDEEDDSSGNSDAELPDEEIEKMLEEDLPESFKTVPKPKQKSYINQQKIMLEEKGVNHFEVLPVDWIKMRHSSGMPIYVHSNSRVCTLSKPYFLGESSTRKHYIPISAIPCLAYRKALEEEEKQNKIDESINEQMKTWAQKPEDSHVENYDFTQDITIGEEISPKSQSEAVILETSSSEKSEGTLDLPSKSIVTNSEPIKDTSEKCDQPKEVIQCHKQTNDEDNEKDDQADGGTQNIVNKDEPSKKPLVLPGGIVMPPPRVENLNKSWKTQHLNPEQFNDYCKKLFKFKTVNDKHFKRWADRRKHVKARKTLQYPKLPESTKLITMPANIKGKGGKSMKRDWLMNMNDCSYLSVFHEYVRRALLTQPVYEYKQIDNAATPYQAAVFIGGMQYGVGYGASKRQAKADAAKTSIHILIPEMKTKLEEHMNNSTQKNNEEPDFSFFDCLEIEDPRIQELCKTTSEPTPYAILRTCLHRNFGNSDNHIKFETKHLARQKIELTLKVGKHTATIIHKNKKIAKQRAAQAVLKSLHPHVHSWGSMLRLYGPRSVLSSRARKLEERQITQLQDKAKKNQPNYAVLEKLRYEMSKLNEKYATAAPLGTLIADNPPTQSGSMLNTVELFPTSPPAQDSSKS